MRVELKPVSKGRKLQVGLLMVLVLSLLFLPNTAEARRALRIEFAGDWGDQLTLPGTECPGTSSQNVSIFNPVKESMGLNLDTVSFEVSGAYTTSSGATSRIEQDYLQNAYCQDGPFLEAFSFPDDEDPALRNLVGDNDTQDVKGLRYTFTPSDSLFDEGVLGFQWVFYTFPNDITLVRFRGLNGDGESISQTTVQVKQSGAVLFEDFSLFTPYNGEFLCFENQTYLGLWDEQTFNFQDPLPGCKIPENQEDDEEEIAPVSTGPSTVDPEQASRRVNGALFLLLGSDIQED